MLSAPDSAITEENMTFDVVTGGAGFIGSHLVDRLLAEGRTVRAVDNFSVGRAKNLEHHKGNAKLEVIEADVADAAAMDKVFTGAERIFHLAARADIVPSIQQPEEYFRSNVDGTFVCLQAARKAEVKRFIYIASSSCYGIPDHYPTPESAEMRPQYPYAVTKLLGEQLMQHWAQVYKIPACSVRFFNIYGPRARTSGTYGAVFGVFLAQLLAGKPLTIVGDGNQTRDFTYVSDAVDAILTVAQSDKVGEVYNIGSNKPVSVNRLVELLGAKETVHMPKRPGEPDCTWADTSHIFNDLGWKPKVTFEEGVQQMLANIDYWRDAPVWTTDSIADATKDWFKYLGNEKAA
jgi:UDP-glucose 4-epimerase